MKLRTILALTTTSIILAACGGGGGGSSDSPQTNTDPLIITDTNTSVVSHRDFLEELFGVLVISFGFENTDTVFSVAADYDSSDFVVEDDSVLLVDQAITFITESGMSTEQGEDTVLFCAAISETLETDPVGYLCGAGFGDATTLFLFEPLVDDAANGFFAYCDSTVSASQCGQRVVNSPSGPVVTLLNTTAMAATARSIPADNTGISVVPYLEYGAQGVADSGVTSSYGNMIGEMADRLINQ